MYCQPSLMNVLSVLEKGRKRKKSDRIYGSFDKGKGCECPGILKSSQQKLLPFVFLRQKDNPPLCTAVLLYMLSLLHTYNCATALQPSRLFLKISCCAIAVCTGALESLSLTHWLCYGRHAVLSTSKTRGIVSMGSMVVMEPINFQVKVLEPIKF